MGEIEGVGSRAQLVSSSFTERARAFERLTQPRLDRAYRLAVALLGDPDEAEDAVIDAAEQAWRDWSSLRDPARFEAWFDRIVVHRCRDRARRLRRGPLPMPDVLEIPEPTQGGGQDERDVLLRAINALSSDHRVVVMLRYLEDLSLEEIAVRTGTRAGTVKSRLHYAMRELRAAYDALQRLPGGHR